ncbi:hypothetical protein JAAARDRAFT_59536 [Jaapia argillacea MUCL 33604]|uniref:F-box domain-containing protein n=1 Tax=Jaapia argillacea MUCL 33604 TaxID=933084 RepID=A0A067PMW5_9AGAM|nr:hypothetical protein JAAARDRAFT_59536 [Jaapia argillacea MUCL 33604]
MKSDNLNRFKCLPTELIISVSSELDFRNVLTCRTISRYIKSIIDNAPLLQYKIELAIARMSDGPNITMTISERRTRLRNYQEAWANLQWKAEELFSTAEGDLWELSGGVWALASGSEHLLSPIAQRVAWNRLEKVDCS